MAKQIRYASSLMAVFAEFVYTIARLRAEKLLSQVDLLEPFRAQWHTVFARELEIYEQQVTAQAMIHARDDDLNDLVDAVVAVLRLIIRGALKKVRNDPRYKRLLGKKTPSEAKRPILGKQLELLRGWHSYLSSDEAPEELKPYAALVLAAVEAADQAVLLQAQADDLNRHFRLVGARKELIDELNRLRDLIYAELSLFPQKYPEKNLPRNYADRFFQQDDTSQSPAEDEAIIQRTQQEIASLEERLIELRAQLADILKKKEERRQQEEALAEVELELAEAQARAEEAARRAEQLRKKLGAKS